MAAIQYFVVSIHPLGCRCLEVLHHLTPLDLFDPRLPGCSDSGSMAAANGKRTIVGSA